MGILREPAEFMRSLGLPKGFSVCELGDQYTTFEDPHRLASEFYKALGCKRYVSIDGNGRGTHLHDLNLPLPKATKIKNFDLATDFGTCEHIFDQCQVWQTLHYLVKPNGGYIVFDHPSGGYDANGGHGFYSINECLYNDLAAANEYEVVMLEHQETVRGKLIRGCFRKVNSQKFRIPQQGRYRKLLRPITGEVPKRKKTWAEKVVAAR